MPNWRNSGPDREVSAEPDVVLLLEGTYPYVRGGVSGWVHQIVQGLPELSFALIFLGGTREMYGEPRYSLPENVVHWEDHFLMEAPETRGPRFRWAGSRRFRGLRELHADFLRDTRPAEFWTRLRGLLDPGDGLEYGDFLYDERAWAFLRERYVAHCPESSFRDYFWSVRLMHAPLFRLGQVLPGVPRAGCYHAISTGYAGLLGAMLASSRQRPFLVTEHGIYTKERRIDLVQAEWIPDGGESAALLDERIGYNRELWMRFFEQLGRITYDAADPIISLFEGNRERQIRDGAPRERTRVIPNGIDVERWRAQRPQPPDDPPPVLALIGRVVAIKDIKSFVRALGDLRSHLPGAEAWIVGPEDEDPDYAAECRDLGGSLGVADQLHFLGFRRMEEVLPQIGLLTLTSISEGQPLVILEAFAAGIPVLATDVGSCRELIEGSGEEDRALGTAGAVVPIANPPATARAAYSLLSDSRRWHAAREAAIARVERYYTDNRVLDRYRDLYQRAKEGWT